MTDEGSNHPPTIELHDSLTIEELVSVFDGLLAANEALHHAAYKPFCASSRAAYILEAQTDVLWEVCERIVKRLRSLTPTSHGQERLRRRTLVRYELECGCEFKDVVSAFAA